MHSKRTGGDWKVIRDESGLSYVVSVRGGHVPIRTAFREGAFLGENRSDHPESEVDANLHLIAMAPQLLRIAESLVLRGHADACEARLNEAHYPCSCLVAEARAAITAATTRP